MRRTLTVLAVSLACVLPAAAAGELPTILPKPRFNTPAGVPKPSAVRFELVSSVPRDPGQLLDGPRPVGLRIDGDVVTAPGRYAFDFRNYVWPPRIAPGERGFVDERVQFAKEFEDVLYVETSHLTYARSSFGLNAYLNAIDLKTRKLRWRSAALVANARNFVLAGDVIVSGYGFTAETDYLYALDRKTGRVLARLLVPSAPERIARHGRTLTVDTYDHTLVVKLLGA